ncbi:response regulator [Azospirillum isscasi]|uniref:Response regulator n=1 Tax=Azospirillum isscasi TaxID=3053926 RepID=A0ABU0WK73_9PROT|nr:response regulator [Azospirillum isscasi]MDQ2104507.1 response regulator [Azospirillum isscasi]
MADPITALVVDEEEMSRAIATGYLTRMGYRTLGVSGGEAAWERLAGQREPVHMVLLDRHLPDMDGMALLDRMKADPDLCSIPVVMQTASDSSADIAQAIQAGVFYYLIKPYHGDLLRAVAAAAIDDHTRLKRLEGDVRSHAGAMTLLQEGVFRFRTLQEAHNLAVAVSSALPKTRKLAFGLVELLLNAVEHGNLGIGYEMKSALKQGNRLIQEIDERLLRPENRNKFATLRIERASESVTFTVSDRGEGFDWTRYLSMDAGRQSAAHGRGIALARMIAFDELAYLGSGSTVVGTVRLAGER